MNRLNRDFARKYPIKYILDWIRDTYGEQVWREKMSELSQKLKRTEDSVRRMWGYKPNGKQELKANQLVIFADVLEVTVDFLLGRSNDSVDTELVNYVQEEQEKVQPSKAIAA